MPSTSKSDCRNSKKSKFVKKPGQRWQVKRPTRNWLELPSDIMANILNRIDALEILESVQKVCTTWRKICKDPAMWKVIYIAGSRWKYSIDNMCKHAVDRSQGQLVDITIVDFAEDEVLLYIAKKSSQLRRLEIAFCDICEAWTEALKKFPLLEELSLCTTEITKEGIETAGRYCHRLKILKLNEEVCTLSDDDDSDEDSMSFNFDINDEIAIAIGGNLHELRHLELVGNYLSNVGLEAILNGCRHLESIDLRGCQCVRLKGDIRKRCSEQIKSIKWPRDSFNGYRYLCDCRTMPRERDDSDHGYYDSDDGFSDCFSDGSYHDYDK